MISQGAGEIALVLLQMLSNRGTRLEASHSPGFIFFLYEMSLLLHSVETAFDGKSRKIAEL